MKEVIERCIANKINLYGYFILNSLYNEEGSKIVEYCLNVDKILTRDFLWLIDNKYLEEVKDRKSIEINDLILTNKFASEILKIANTRNITFDVAFDQLKEHFPIKAGNSERRLQGNVDKCKNLYKATIVKNSVVDEELHSVILQCINYEIKTRIKGRNLDYFQLLETWIRQKTWQLYYDDVIEIIKKSGSVNRGSVDNGDEGENKTMLGSEDF